MSWLDDLHARDPGAWEAMNDAGRIPPAVDIDALVEDATCRTCRGTGWNQGGCDECGATGVEDE